jgi:zinc transporter ZupT
MVDPKVITALILTCLGAAGTSLGAFIVVLHPKMQFKRLGVFQGLAAGLMLSISVFDLFQESQKAIGELWANVWFFAGVIFFAVVVAFIPEPDFGTLVLDDDDDHALQESQGAMADAHEVTTPMASTSPIASETRSTALRLRQVLQNPCGGVHLPSLPYRGSITTCKTVKSATVVTH